MNSFEQIGVTQARQFARDAGASNVPTVASYIGHCYDDDGGADVANTLEQLKRNQPQLFARSARYRRAARYQH